MRSPSKFIPHSNTFYEQSEFAVTPKRQMTALALEVIQAPPGTARSRRPTHL